MKSINTMPIGNILPKRTFILKSLYRKVEIEGCMDFNGTYVNDNT